MKNKFIQLSSLLFLFCSTLAYSNPINKINFIGLNNTSESTLLELIPFEIGQNYSPYASDKIIEALFETELFENISIIKNDNSLNISLKENPNIKYFEIKLINDSAFSNWIKGEKIHFTSEVLDEQIVENKLSTGNVFTKRKLEGFVSLLESKYSESGYFNSVITQDIQIDAQNRVGIELSVNQGNRASIDSFDISGSEKISKKELLKLFKIGEPDMVLINYFTNKDDFTDSKLRNGINLMSQTYFDLGYLDFEILDVEISLNDNKEKLTINIEVSEGIQYKLGDVSFEGELGNISLNELNNNISMVKGDVFNRNLIISNIQSITDIYADNFSDVQISTSEVEGMSDKIDINFTVEETQTGAISFTMSHSNNYGMTFGAGIQEKNIFGSGNTLNADLKIAESFNKVNFYFVNPNFNNEGHSVSIGAFRSEIDNDDIAANSYEIDSTGVNFGYGLPLSDNTRINAGLEYSKNEVKCSTLFSGSGYESSQCASKNNDEFKVNVNWSENTLNNYMYPTDGINNSVTAAISLPLGDYQYFNLSADHSSYTPINTSATLKLTGNFNLSKGYSGKELPFYKRHFGGGSGSIRGFGNKSLGPLYPNGKAKGGEISILGSANLITPAFFFEDNDKMRMSAFIDAGNIYQKSSNIKLGDIRMSAGFGFAYLSPIGSIGAFISTPILKKSGDVIEDFGFSLGTGF